MKVQTDASRNQLWSRGESDVNGNSCCVVGSRSPCATGMSGARPGCQTYPLPRLFCLCMRPLPVNPSSQQERRRTSTLVRNANGVSTTASNEANATCPHPMQHRDMLSLANAEGRSAFTEIREILLGCLPGLGERDGTG